VFIFQKGDGGESTNRLGGAKVGAKLVLGRTFGRGSRRGKGPSLSEDLSHIAVLPERDSKKEDLTRLSTW